MSAPRHLKAVKDVLDGAAEPPIDDFDLPGGRRGGDDDGGAEIAMPAGCPVVPLGTCGNIFWFLTALGELRGLAADKVANKHIVGMFAPLTDYLFEHWPRKKEIEDEDGNTEWIVTGWRADDVSMELMRVCGARGVWNPRDKVRGRGAHVDDFGRLILHCGSHVLMNGTWRRPGDYDGFVYPTAPAIARPSPKVAGSEAGVELLSWLKSWRWARPTIDPMLALGWITIARLGGAIRWRPLIWITGGHGEGKSTLMELIADLFDGGLLELQGATEAAVRQLLGQDTLPVVLDEMESEEDDRQMQAIIKLARVAASGGNIGKGGADHQGVQFTARSCFVFSSILIPPLQPQDKSRMGVLELKRLPTGARDFKVTPAERRAMAAALTRRIVDHWGRWESVFEAFSDALIDHGGHKGRGAKVFATLLAAAHIALEDEAPGEEELVMWGRELAVSRLAELSDADGDDKRCVHHLGTSQVQLSGSGSMRMVEEWVGQAVRAGDMDGNLRAKEALARIGIGIVAGAFRRRDPGDEDDTRPRPVPGRTYLAIANAHQGLGKLFEASPWKGRAGASGVWSQSLKRIEGAVPNERQRIGGKTMACTLVPIEAMIDVAEPAAVGVAAEVEDA